MTDNQADLDEYSYYLGIFFVLGFGLLALTAWYQVHYAGFPYGSVTWLVAFGACVVPVNCQPKHYLLGDRKKGPVSLQVKKTALIVSLILYILCAALLMMWGGGRASAAADFLVLTTGISVFVAKEPATKWVVAAVALGCYAGASLYWFDPTLKVMRIEWLGGMMVVDFAAVVFVVIISAVTSREIANRQRAATPG